jgi:hypothetical protein
MRALERSTLSLSSPPLRGIQCLVQLLVPRPLLRRSQARAFAKAGPHLAGAWRSGGRRPSMSKHLPRW